MDSSERKLRIDFLKNISIFFDNQSEKNGGIFCSKDRVEHTGKEAYSIIIDCKLFELTKKEIYFKRAKRRALRIINNFIDDPDYSYGIFYPGRLDPRNAVNTVIGGGGCLDSLVTFLSVFRERLTQKEIGGIERAIYRHADEYLKKAVKQKPIANQRLWGAVGLAAAYQIFKKPEWKQSLLQSIRISLKEQNPDGSFPYIHPQRLGPQRHLGLTDITPYYHSRHLAFIIDILDKIGEPRLFSKQLKKGADFLIGMYQPNGVKNIFLEAKRWYWESDYEVASNSFDVYLLTRIYQRTKDKIYQYYSARSFQKLLEHQVKDGGIVSHFGKGYNWQCRIVWNSHLAWVAKVIEEIPNFINHNKIEFVRDFQEAGLFKWEKKTFCALIRYKKRPMNIDSGSSLGGGSLIYLGEQGNHWLNKLNLKSWTSKSDNNFVIKPKGSHFFKNLKEFLNQNKREFRGQRWRFWVELTAGKIFFACRKIFREIIIKLIEQMKNEYTTQWALETKTKKGGDNNQTFLVFKSQPARRDGTILKDCFFSRQYILENGKIYLEEHLESKEPLKSLRYYKNGNFKYQIKSSNHFIEKEKYIQFRTSQPIKIKIRITF